MRSLAVLCRSVIAPSCRYAGRLKAQIQADTQFLQRNGIVDYSLLLGVHKTGLDYRKEAAAWIEKNQRALEKKWKSLTGKELLTSLSYPQFCLLAYRHSAGGADDRPLAEGGQGGRSVFKTDCGGMKSYRCAAPLRPSRALVERQIVSDNDLPGQGGSGGRAGNHRRGDPLRRHHRHADPLR